MTTEWKYLLHTGLQCKCLSDEIANLGVLKNTENSQTKIGLKSNT